MNFERARFAPPPPPKKVQVRVLFSTFRVDGRTPQVGEVVSVDEDIARSLAAVGKVALAVH